VLKQPDKHDRGCRGTDDGARRSRQSEAHRDSSDAARNLGPEGDYLANPLVLLRLVRLVDHPDASLLRPSLLHTGWRLPRYGQPQQSGHVFNSYASDRAIVVSLRATTVLRSPTRQGPN
jgi:hypothetical protein